MDPTSAGLRTAVWLTCCGFLAALVAFLINLNRPFGLTDEGFQYLLSRAWAQHENLFQRFDLLYPAGQYAWYGSFMRFFGDSVWVLRLGRAVLTGITAALVWHAVGRWSGRAVAWAVAMAVAVADPGMASGFAAAAVLASVLGVARPQHPSPRVLTLTAALAGWLLAWREDAAVLALVLALYVGWRRHGGALDVLRTAGGFVAGLAPWLVLEAARGELAPFVSHTAQRVGFLFTRLGQPGYAPTVMEVGTAATSPRSVVESQLSVLVFVPPLLYSGLLVWQWWRRHEGWRVEGQHVAAALVGLAFVPQYLWERPDVWHLRAHLVVLLPVLGVALGACSAGWRRRGAAALLAFAAGLGGLLLVQYRISDARLYPCGEGRRIGARLEKGAPPWACLPAAPGETLIVLPWGPGWYAVEGLPPGTRILTTVAAHLDRPGVVETACADLGRRTNRWVITSRGYGRGGQLAGQRALAGVIAGHYREVGAWVGGELWDRVVGGGVGGLTTTGAR